MTTIAPERLAAARAAILANETLQTELAAAADAHALGALVAQHLPHTGDAAEWSAWLAGAAEAPPGPPEWSMDEAPPRQWLPVQVYGDGTHLYVEWLHFAFAPLAEPFFEQSAARVRSHPLNLLLRCTTRLDALTPLAALPMPDGLVFHMSRCGSTLVGQMLDALGTVTVVSEPPPLDSVVQLWLGGHVRPDLIRAMAAALVRDRGDGKRYRSIKLDAWHVLQLPAISALFPAARSLFLFRDPLEVLVSQVRQPGMHARRGEVPFATFGLPGADKVPDADFIPWVVAAVARAGLAAAGQPGLRLIDYAALPDAFTATILPHLGIGLPTERAAALAEASGRYSKDAARAFAPDGADKQRAARPELRAQAAAQAMPELYAGLVSAAAGNAPPRRPNHGATAATRVTITFS